jgi:hypothetical protein
VSAATESIATTSSTRADEQLRDLERLLAGVRLRDEEVVDVDADPLAYAGSIACSASMNAQMPPRLRLGDHVHERRLAGRPGPDLDDAPVEDHRP